MSTGDEETHETDAGNAIVLNGSRFVVPAEPQHGWSKENSTELQFCLEFLLDAAAECVAEAQTQASKPGLVCDTSSVPVPSDQKKQTKPSKKSERIAGAAKEKEAKQLKIAARYSVSTNQPAKQRAPLSPVQSKPSQSNKLSKTVEAVAAKPLSPKEKARAKRLSDAAHTLPPRRHSQERPQESPEAQKMVLCAACCFCVV
jgi:hypothetical protein